MQTVRYVTERSVLPIFHNFILTPLIYQPLLVPVELNGGNTNLIRQLPSELGLLSKLGEPALLFLVVDYRHPILPIAFPATISIHQTGISGTIPTQFGNIVNLRKCHRRTGLACATFGRYISNVKRRILS